MHCIILTLILLIIFHQGKARKSKYLVKTLEGKQKLVEVEKSAFHDRIKFGNTPNKLFQMTPSISTEKDQ